MNKTRIAISISEKILKDLDLISKDHGDNRSWVINQMFEHSIRFGFDKIVAENRKNSK
jgi:metal-responsive CopG/Arc/MetJ family transcriptional regulator